LPIISSLSIDIDAWLIAATLTGKTQCLDGAVGAYLHLHMNLVAAQRIDALGLESRIVDGAKVLGMPVVLENILAIHVVHSGQVIPHGAGSR